MLLRLFRYVIPVLTAVAFLLVASVPHAQEAATVLNKETAKTLEAMAARTMSLGDFGRVVKDGALLAAASKLRKGEIRGDTVTFKLTFSVTELSRPDVPDACFEICLSERPVSAVRCYVQCNAPIP